MKKVIILIILSLLLNFKMVDAKISPDDRHTYKVSETPNISINSDILREISLVNQIILAERSQSILGTNWRERYQVNWYCYTETMIMKVVFQAVLEILGAMENGSGDTLEGQNDKSKRKER